LQHDVEDDVVAGDVRLDVVVHEVRRKGLGVEERARQAQHELARAPVGHVDEPVEVALHQLTGIAPEVAVVVDVREPPRGNLSTRGDSA
jgi:hypothetical protein